MSAGSDRRCVFCNQAAGSREHALPQWLAISMGVQDLPVQPGLITSARGIEPQGNARAAGKLITKGVCSGCNGGWMCDLEGVVKPFLAPLVAIDFEQRTNESLDPLEENFDLLVRWLLKTAVALSLVAPKGEFGTLPQEAPNWAYTNAIPDSFRIYSGWLDHGGFGNTLGRGFRMVNGGRFHGNQVHPQSFDFRIHLNRLAIRLVNAPGATWGLTSCYDRDGKLCSPRILGGDWGFAGAETDSIVFRNFSEFSKVCVLMTGGLTDSLDPEEEHRMAKSIRRLIP